MSFIQFRNVHKRYQMGEVTIHAVKGISFNIEQGEFTVVVGASGAGKTTVLNLLGGMDSLSEGTIIVNGKEISSYNERQLTEYRRNELGFVFQLLLVVEIVL